METHLVYLLEQLKINEDFFETEAVQFVSSFFNDQKQKKVNLDILIEEILRKKVVSKSFFVFWYLSLNTQNTQNQNIETLLERLKDHLHPLKVKLMRGYLSARVWKNPPGGMWTEMFRENLLFSDVKLQAYSLYKEN